MSDTVNAADLRRMLAKQTEEISKIRLALRQVPKLKRHLKYRDELRVKILEQLQELGEV